MKVTEPGLFGLDFLQYIWLQVKLGPYLTVQNSNKVRKKYVGSEVIVDALLFCQITC